MGTPKLKTIGTDLGEAIRNFRKALNEEQKNEPPKEDNISS
nr:twin-arginine translocase TatA/TatE family subunit [Legionella steigerwaltii]